VGYINWHAQIAIGCILDRQVGLLYKVQRTFLQL
jgi:hypothetical protein